MRFAAKDGSMHPSQKAAFDAGQKAPAADSPQDPSQDGSQPQPIQDNPDAMQLVDQLKQMGYTADDVAQAMDGEGGQAAPTGGAPLNIPGAQ